MRQSGVKRLPVGRPRAGRTRGHHLPATLVLAAGVATGVAACAPTVNLEDPAGPRFASDARTERTSLATATPGQLRVVTYNIMYGRGVERAVEVLRTPPLRAADVVALQEVDEEGAARIAAALAMEYVYYPATVHPVEQRHFGSALLSAWPIERDWKVILPHRSPWRGQQRTATAAVLRLGDARVRVYAVHLELATNLTPAQRRDQVSRLLDDAAGAPEPVILAGDFNGPDIAPQLEAAGYAWATRDVPPSLLFLRPDHVFSRGLTAAAAGTFTPPRRASDHHPVWSTLSFTR